MKLLCNGESLWEAGAERDLVERLEERVVSEARGKGSMENRGRNRNA